MKALLSPRALAPFLLSLACAALAGQKSSTTPLKAPPLEEVRREIEAARNVKGVKLPDPAKRSRVVARVNGEPITFQEVLDEVLQRFGTPLVTGLANQALIAAEVATRDVPITEEEFLREVGLYLAERRKAGARKTLKEILAAAQLDWPTFARMIRERARIAKVVRADLNLKNNQGPLNPLLLQVWAARKLRQRYHIELDRRRLPADVFARIEGRRPLAGVLAALAAGCLTVGPADQEGVWLVPPGGGWPRYRVPALTVRAEGMPPLETEALLRRVAAGAALAKELVLRRADGAVLRLPAAMAIREGPGAEKASVPLGEALAALAAGTHRLEDRQLVPKEGQKGAVYRLPKLSVRHGEDAQPLPALLATWWRGKVQIATELVIAGAYRLPDTPVLLRSDVDRETLLRFCFGRLEKRHYREALESLARFKAIKQKFRKLGITVDENAVAAAIAAQEKRYAHPLFNRQLILQAMGKTVFEENRRLWVADGVDQILKPQVTEEDLRAYYQKHLDRYAGAGREVSHILVAARREGQAKPDWEAAERRIEEIARRLFAHPRPAQLFHAVARQFSDDETTARQGGRLGLVTRRSPYDRNFIEACFSLRPGQISAPVRTEHGYHLILCEKVVPPDPERYSLRRPEIRAMVRDDYLQELRDRWLAKHVFRSMKLEQVGPLLPR